MAEDSRGPCPFRADQTSIIAEFTDKWGKVIRAADIKAE
jgi:hypothetical protein